MHPARLAFDAARSVAQPGDFGCDVCAVREGVEEAFSHVVGATDAVEEFGLQEAWDAEGGTGEGYAEGRVGADEEVLGRRVSVTVSE